MKIRLAALLIAVLCLAVAAHAQVPPPPELGQAANQIRGMGAFGIGARALGMGGAFTAVADGPTAVYWNPAGLAQSHGFRTAFSITGRVENLDAVTKGRHLYDAINNVVDAINSDTGTVDVDTFNDLWNSSAALSGRQVNADISAGLIGLSCGHLGFGIWAQGAGAARLDQSPTLSTTSYAAANAKSLGYATAGLGYGWSLGPTLDVGVSARYMVAAAAKAHFRVHGDGDNFIIDEDNGYSTGNDSNIGVDLGMIWRPQPAIYKGRVRIAAMVRDINSPSFDLPETVRFDPNLNVGLAVTMPDNKWLLAVDVDNVTASNDYSAQVCAGVEYSVNKWLDLRAGLYQGELTKGIGINLGAFKLSAAIGNSWDEMSSFSADFDF